ncbi:MAG: DUF983 domain-containing protein [Parvularculaceae bacterium]|nr:DUF983 domain-containing protein [Parvularculaceae bacterium]
MTDYPPVSPFAAGLSGKCPRCGQGALFKSFLGLGDRCAVCKLDYSKADPGDGPAVFVILFVGFVAVAAAFILRFVFFAPLATAFAVAGGAAIFLSLALLRPLKATLIALQYRHKAEQGRLQE